MSDRRSIVLLALATLACLAPFAAKPVHVDDPLFLWTAEALRTHGADFHRALVNWYGTEEPIGRVAQNPPGWSAMLTAWAAVFGKTIVAAHALAFTAACAAVLATWRLARGFTQRPAVAALALLAAPAFFVSSTTLMCDVPMLAAFVGALAAWREGWNEDRAAKLVLAGALVALAVLLKYSAVIALPLLALDLALRWRRGARGGIVHGAAAGVVLPLVVLGAYEVATQRLTGSGLFTQALAYAARERARSPFAPAAETCIALAFVGGSAAAAVVLLCASLARTWVAACAAAAIACVVALAFARPPGLPWLFDERGVRLAYAAQMVVWIAAGLVAVTGAAVGLVRRGAPDRTWLAAWLVLALAFGAFLNWTLNARSLLLALPALAILAARASESVALTRTSLRAVLACVPALALSIVAAVSDLQHAEAQRDAASSIAGLARRVGARFVFQGHWGFQWYAQSAGGEPLDFARTELAPGDLVALPRGGTNVRDLPSDACETVATIERPLASPLSLLDERRGAGFYARSFGALPFVLGEPAWQRVDVVRMRRALRPPR